jgi:hypothetical protein
MDGIFYKIELVFKSKAFLDNHNLVKTKVKKFQGKPVGKPFTNLSRKPIVRRTTNK